MSTKHTHGSRYQYKLHKHLSDDELTKREEAESRLESLLDGFSLKTKSKETLEEVDGLSPECTDQIRTVRGKEIIS